MFAATWLHVFVMLIRYSSAEAAPWLSPAQDALPPVPLLDSSDALDVVVATPPVARLPRLLLSQGSCLVTLTTQDKSPPGPTFRENGSGPF